jgi:hypothetical protein
MNQSHFDVLIAMSKRTKVPILTDKILLVLLVRLREAMAKLCFVLISVVQALHSVVSTPASVLLGTLFSVSELAKFWCVDSILSSFIFEAVEVEAALMIVGSLLPWALEPLEPIEVKMSYNYGALRLMMDLLKQNKEILLALLSRSLKTRVKLGLIKPLKRLVD